jgi:hypothetical protein
MRRILVWALVGLGVAAVDAARAIDINPSKNNQQPSFWDTGGNSFSIFNGDPKRIQRANEVDPKSFDVKIDVSPTPLSLAASKGATIPTAIKITFSVHNHAKKTYTLSFPTAQRWDFRILTSAGTSIYTYSDNCMFEQKIGTSMVNNDDKLVYSEIVQMSDLGAPLIPGNYTVQGVLANYPAMHATTILTVTP